jgi:hypothetical protein
MGGEYQISLLIGPSLSNEGTIESSNWFMSFASFIALEQAHQPDYRWGISSPLPTANARSIRAITKASPPGRTFRGNTAPTCAGSSSLKATRNRPPSSSSAISVSSVHRWMTCEICFSVEEVRQLWALTRNSNRVNRSNKSPFSCRLVSRSRSPVDTPASSCCFRPSLP